MLTRVAVCAAAKEMIMSPDMQRAIEALARGSLSVSDRLVTDQTNDHERRVRYELVASIHEATIDPGSGQALDMPLGRTLDLTPAEILELLTEHGADWDSDPERDPRRGQPSS